MQFPTDSGIGQLRVLPLRVVHVIVRFQKPLGDRITCTGLSDIRVQHMTRTALGQTSLLVSTLLSIHFRLGTSTGECQLPAFGTRCSVAKEYRKLVADFPVHIPNRQ